MSQKQLCYKCHNCQYKIKIRQVLFLIPLCGKEKYMKDKYDLFPIISFVVLEE